MIRLTCPHCGESLEFPDSLDGTTEACPVCHTTVWIPILPSPAARRSLAARRRSLDWEKLIKFGSKAVWSLFMVIVGIIILVKWHSCSDTDPNAQRIEDIAGACVRLSESQWRILQAWDTTYCMYSINNNLREINAGEKVTAPPNADWVELWTEQINSMHLPVGTSYSDSEAEVLHQAVMKTKARRN